MDFAKVGVTRLNSRNYRSWSFKVQMLLLREGTWSYVEPGIPPNPVTAEWTEGDAKARAAIVLLVEDNQHNLIIAKTTAKSTWEALKSHHHKATLTGKVALLKEICSTDYQEGDNMEEFLYGMEDLFSRLENSGEKLSDYMQVAMILRSLPKAFDSLTTALESRADVELTMDLVRSKLIDESEKLFGGKSVDERVLKSDSSGRGPATCYFCGVAGHKKNCRKFLSEKTNEKKSKPKLKKVRENDKKSFTFKVRANQHTSESRLWLLDSGATSHMCSDERLFVELSRKSRSSVIVADGSEKSVEGIGSCLIDCVNSIGEAIELTLSDVLFVPELEGNMISISKLAAKGVQTTFNNTGCKMIYANSIIAVGDKIDNMYWLRICQDRVNKVNEKAHQKNCQHIWHSRLGHRDVNVLNEIQQKKLATGCDVVNCGKVLTCESCIKGKMTRPSFHRIAEKSSSAVLDVVHSDVCGPIDPVSPGGCRYYVTLIDDFSRFCFVYFLKRKSEVAQKIQEYVRMTENQFGRKPRAIRSDQGGEYSGKCLRQFYLAEGIRPQFTAAYSPQQNGVSERKNRSLCEMARCMLEESGLAKKFWAEAINTACYVQNRLPTSATARTPFELCPSNQNSLKKVP